MDNCPIHHIDEVTEIIQQTGALVHWLPPYSPDYNPIEEAFSNQEHDENNGSGDAGLTRY